MSSASSNPNAETPPAAEPKADPYKHMTVKHHFIGGMYTKELRIPPGVVHAKHRHSFDHTSVLASGTAIVEVDGVATEHTGPIVLTMKAKAAHSVTALTPIVWLCQHATDRIEPDGIDEELVANA